MLKWLKKFGREPDPLAPLGFEPRFFDPENAPFGSVTVSIENDDETKLEFVVQLLNEYFGFKISRGVEIAMKIHKEGSMEIRVMKSVDAKYIVGKARKEAKKRGFPLTLTVSPNVES